MQNVTGWQFWIDRGGTFTDVIGLSPAGELRIRKLLSRQSGAGDPGIRAVREILGSAEAAAGKGSHIDAVKVGTTVATNALLERKGEPVLLVTTADSPTGCVSGIRTAPISSPGASCCLIVSIRR